MPEKGLTKNQILSELTRSPHGKLQEYVPVAGEAAKQEADFYAHLVAWNRHNGHIRDSQVALPVISLGVNDFPAELQENSLAHIALLGPRELERAFRFNAELKQPTQKFRNLIKRYLSEKEADGKAWERVAVQHRRTLKNLYALAHKSCSERISSILWGSVRTELGKPQEKRAIPSGSVFEDVANLSKMTPSQAATTIITRKIPFLIAFGALGAKAKETDLVLALINAMSSTELVTNTKMLDKLGMKSNPVLRGAYEKALEKASKSKKNVLKTTRAAEAIEDETLKTKLRGLQDRQIQASGGVEGDWLVLADKSGSMHQAIEVARHVSATLSKYVKGKVYLVFFDTQPAYMDVTGKSLEEIKKMTQYIAASGGTSIGCGLQRMLDNSVVVDGIAIVSDGGENNAPFFPNVYQKYSVLAGKEVPVYLYHCDGDDPALIRSMNSAGIDMQVFDLNRGLDYYALPNLVQTMRTQRYGLVEEVMATKLLTLEDVFKSTPKAEVISA